MADTGITSFENDALLISQQIQSADQILAHHAPTIVREILRKTDCTQETPINLASIIAEEEAFAEGRELTANAVLAAARKILIESFRSKSYELTKRSVLAPIENGETIADNDIYELTFPELSDHIYWIVLPKGSDQKPYLYGFN